jgi:hypothetical protein
MAFRIKKVYLHGANFLSETLKKLSHENLFTPFIACLNNKCL